MRQWINLFENETLSDFIKEVRAFNDGEGGWMDRDYQDRLSFSTEHYHFTLGESDGGRVVEIANIDVGEEYRGNGHAAQVMKELCSLADKYRVKLTLVADESNGSYWLQDWYSSLGFDYTNDVSDYGPWMERLPH